MTLKTTFPDKIFSSMIPDVILSTDATRVHVTIAMVSQSSPIYEENLYPDTTGVITIGDIPILIQPFAKSSLVDTLTVTLLDQTVTTNSDGSKTISDGTSTTLSTSVIYCAAEVSIDATTFCSNHFLSRLIGDHTTALGRLEYLHFDSATDKAVITATYDDQSTQQFDATIVGGNGSTYTTIDVSPSQYIQNNKILICYSVSCASRKQTFVIDFNAPTEYNPVLLFTNSFGCQELAYCSGIHKVQPDIKFSNTYIKGEMRTYDIEELRPMAADTGVLTFPMADWLTDLFRSDEIYAVTFINGVPKVGRRVILSEQKSDISNADEELPRYTFTYRFARRNQNYIDVSSEGRIFDNTFDFTFN